jgi:3-hydroxyacyl-CoA dehydrogenase
MQMAVLGCGLIGASWTALFLAHGHDVAAWDPDAGIRDSLPDHIAPSLAQLAALEQGAGTRGRLAICDRPEDAVMQAGLVQENAPEDALLKRALYARVEAAATADAIIASSTSSLVWSDLASDMARPDRFVTAHPFNPPHLMPLVELHGRDPAILARAEAIYRGLGRHTVRLRHEAVGHIANRLASALWREAVSIVADGIADVADVDAALVHGPGLRWSVVGAHMGYHLGGGSGGLAHYLDHLGPSQERRWATLGTPSLTPEIRALLIAGIEAEAAGRSLPDLEAERDAGLIAALQARRGRDDPAA